MIIGDGVYKDCSGDKSLINAIPAEPDLVKAPDVIYNRDEIEVGGTGNKIKYGWYR